MTERNMIDDVRAAKSSVDQQSPQWESLAHRLQAIERTFANRTGEFASVPTSQPPAVHAAIAQAQDEPGSALLNDTRQAKPA